ncbi:hypothetical protein [Collimonas sp.]|jgi:hypothetical protein|uniref:hypothetical protein n=1 Tax=Collimonas sp. TaxID=1963772 RepID=UPI002BD99CCA|nr:hypothetical protein [Collimonas sp.]HWW07537.1 hypothetical protein [Collimonas sp.]
MSTDIDLKSFSDHRLGGHPVPKDLQLLLVHVKEVQKLTGIKVSDSAEWAPWLDVSYLSEADLNNPEISANIEAISAVCKYVSFVAATEDSEYIGYWRGPKIQNLSQSPIVRLDNEGQFNVCAGMNIVEALLADIYNGSTFLKFKRLFESVGMELPYASYAEIPYKDDPVDETYVRPAELHNELYGTFRNLKK